MGFFDDFRSERDQHILDMYRSGKRADYIARKIGVPELKLLHDLTRILNEEADKHMREWRVTFADYRKPKRKRSNANHNNRAGKDGGRVIRRARL